MGVIMYKGEQYGNQLDISGKVDKVTGKGLSSNDYTDAEKLKLASVENGAQVNTVTGVKGNAEADYRAGKINITPTNIGLGNVDNTSDLDKPISTATQEALDEKVDVVEGKGLSTEDYTSAEKTKLANIEANAQVNTITGVKGDSESEYRTGNINITKANIGLSNVDNTSDVNKPISTATQTALNNKISTSLKGAASGVAELDENGKVPTSQLPSFVDDVVEYSSSSNFPLEGEAGKIYVDTLDNKTYRWSGSGYVEISPSLALGETSSTAYRGDRGKTAYDHAAAKGSAFTSGLYKITTNAEGHVIAVTAVTKADITALGIPGSDTDNNTTYTITQDASDGHKLTLTGSDGSSKSITIPDNSLLTVTTSIPANANLNAAEYRNVGTYSANTTAIAKTITNAPVENAFRMNVYNLAGSNYSRMQEVIIYNNSERYYRICTADSNNNWSYEEWKPFANLHSMTKLSNASAAATETAGRVYPVALDKDGKLAVNVPWSNTTYSNATTSTAGLMSAADKTKLDNMQSQIDQWKSYTQALRSAMQDYIDNLPEAPGDMA